MHILNGRNWWLTSGWRVRCSPHIFRRKWTVTAGRFYWDCRAYRRPYMDDDCHYPCPNETIQIKSTLSWLPAFVDVIAIWASRYHSTVRHPALGDQQKPSEWQRYGCWPRVRMKPSIGRWTCTCQLFCQIFWGSCGRVPEFWFTPELVQSFPVSGLVCFLHQIQCFTTLYVPSI